MPIDPLQLNKLEIVRDDSAGPISLNIDLFNVSISGYSKMKCNNLNGFSPNASEVQLKFFGSIPRMNIQGHYVATGSILILPIVGNGAANITLSKSLKKKKKRINGFNFGPFYVVNVEFSGLFVTTVNRRNGVEYLDLNRVIVDFTATRYGVEMYFFRKKERLFCIFKTRRMYFRLANLFNGDRLLGDTTNRFLNENWRDVYSELRPAVSKSIADMNKSVVKPVFDKIPFAELYENAFRV